MNKKFLTAIYQNTKMAIQSINDMYPKFRSSKLKQLMKDYEEGYTSYANQCLSIAKQKNIELKDSNLFSKIMLWTSINCSTLFKKSASHIAELFLLGTVRGTLSLYKDLKTYKNADQDIIDIAKKLLEFEEQSYEKIKEYLRA